MPNIRVAIPSHLVTIPFLFGLKHHTIKDELVIAEKKYPDSVRALLANEVDLALIPIERLHEINNYQIVSELCISSQREMQSILLVINGDIANLETIYIDKNQPIAESLIRILANGFWNCSPSYQPLTSKEILHNLKLGEGALFVGDEAIAESHTFGCTVDLSSEWKKFTGLPLVVAAWVSTKPLPFNFREQFDEALRFGINNIDNAIAEMTFSNDFPKAKVRRYLSHGISYILDQEKVVSMELFLKLQAKRQVAFAV